MFFNTNHEYIYKRVKRSSELLHFFKITGTPDDFLVIRRYSGVFLNKNSAGKMGIVVFGK